MFDIIGVGDADIDIMLKVDHIPGHDEKVLGQMLGKFPGGMVANYLSAAAAFGAKCGAVVSVGETTSAGSPSGTWKNGAWIFPTASCGWGRTPISQ